MNCKTTFRTTIAAAALAAAAAAPSAQAQDLLGAMIQQQMNQMNQMLGYGQQMVDQTVQQKMHDPAVRAAYQQHAYQMSARGLPPMDYATFTHQYIYTMGFSAAGRIHMQQTENGNRAGEMRSWQGVRGAEENRANSMQSQRDNYFYNQQETGRGLMGQSTYYGAGGWQNQLPHTWQPNTSNHYQGQQYYVDHGGRYYVIHNGSMYPINR